MLIGHDIQKPARCWAKHLGDVVSVQGSDRWAIGTNHYPGEGSKKNK